MKYKIEKEIPAILVNCQQLAPMRDLRAIATLLTATMLSIFKENSNNEKIADILITIRRKECSTFGSGSEIMLHKLRFPDVEFCKTHFSSIFREMEENAREEYIKKFAEVVEDITYRHISNVVTRITIEENEANRIVDEKKDKEHKAFLASLAAYQKKSFYNSEQKEEEKTRGMENIKPEEDEIDRILGM